MCTLGSATYSSWNKLKRKRNKQFGHTDLFRYFKIFNKCIDFGCIFIVVHRSWGPAPEYWMLTQNFEVDVPYCSLTLVLRTGPILVDFSVTIVTYWWWWLCHEALDCWLQLVTVRWGWSGCWRWCCEALCTWSPAASHLWTSIEPPPGPLSAWVEKNTITQCMQNKPLGSLIHWM